jgi:hypothetical protein
VVLLDEEFNPERVDGLSGKVTLGFEERDGEIVDQEKSYPLRPTHGERMAVAIADEQFGVARGYQSVSYALPRAATESGFDETRLASWVSVSDPPGEPTRAPLVQR